VDNDIYLLQRFGRELDCAAKWPTRPEAPSNLLEPTLRDSLIGEFLRIRAKNNQLLPMLLNAAQAEYSRTCTRRNIVLKARQLGITTYVAARYFIQTITRPGTLTVQVAHDQESAEEIFRIVHRFWANLPGRAGSDKKEAALTFVGSALSLTEAVANREIVDQNKFKEGLSKMIDGVVDCLNASVWAKK
jgi:hypothetical protein